MNIKNPLDAPEELFHLGVKALIRNKSGKILVLEANIKTHYVPRDGYWELPGGRIQKGGNFIDTLKRELEEEIGVKQVKIHRLFDASLSKHRVHFPQASVGLILFTYLCSIPETEKITIIDDEHLRFDWVSPKKAAKLLESKFSESLTDKVSGLK